MPLVAPRGAMLAMKGESAEAEIAAAAEVVAALGCADPVVELLGTDLDPDLGVEPIRVVRVTWADPARVSLPAPGRSGEKSSRGRTSPSAARRGGPRNKRRKS
jgi:16S rRNA (guanine527-N7)-methyltransferase